MKNSKEYCEAKKSAIENAKDATASFVFEAGFDFAMAQPKHIFDGVAQVGEVRRFEGELVDVVKWELNVNSSCVKCVLYKFSENSNCQYLTGCDTHNVKYIKRV